MLDYEIISCEIPVTFCFGRLLTADLLLRGLIDLFVGDFTQTL
jgi:hypothetical protein